MGVSVTVPFTFVNGTTADATQVDANFTAITSALAASAAGSGINADISALTALTTPLTLSQGGTGIFVGSGATGTNTIVIPTTIPANFTLTAGNTLVWQAGGTNTGPATVNANNTGAKSILNRSGTNFGGNEIRFGSMAMAVYNGSAYELISPDNVFVQNYTDQLIVGFNVSSLNAGTFSGSATYTPDAGQGLTQFLTNAGAFTVAAPAGDCTMVFDIVNTAGAQVPSFVGYRAGNVGDTITTVNGSIFRVTVSKINNIASYFVRALQ